MSTSIESSQYQGSQAFNQLLTMTEQVSPNTGSIVLAKPIVNLQGINKNIPLNISLIYSQGIQGILGLPKNWSFGIPYVIPGECLVAQGITSLIPPTGSSWEDSTGYSSGLMYVNNHGVKFKQIIPPQSLPSGGGEYAYQFTNGKGENFYFDGTGKLLEQSDIFGNQIKYFYEKQETGVIGNYLSKIVDTYGQIVTFSYDIIKNSIVVTLPNGSKFTINYSAQGVQNFLDLLNCRTEFYYNSNTGTVNEITYPTGLITKIEYTSIYYNYKSSSQQNPQKKSFQAVSDLYHTNNSKVILDHTKYVFGSSSGGNTFTGYSGNYCLSANNDGLMDSNNTAYLYDVLIEKLDSDEKLLMATRIYYNYLHLPITIEKYQIDYTTEPKGSTINGYKISNTYVPSTNQHARTTNYNKPQTIEQFIWSSSQQQYLFCNKKVSTYDLYGNLLTNQIFNLDQTKPTVSITKTYVITPFGIEMPLTETSEDLISNFKKQATYSLTSDQKSVETITTCFQSSTDDNWKPWKTINYTYDTQGRKKTEVLQWSSGYSIPQNSISSTEADYSYDYNQSTSVLKVTRTNALGYQEINSYDVSLPKAPKIILENAIGEVTTSHYDFLGRLVNHTNVEGLTTTISYQSMQIDGVNNALTTDPSGYQIAEYYDELGRSIKLMDNGDPTNSSPSLSRILNETQYNSINLIFKSKNITGLETTYEYDAFKRLSQVIDHLNNIKTFVYDELSGVASLNGVKESETQKDGLQRTVLLNKYPNQNVEGAIYYTSQSKNYNGFNQLTQVAFDAKDLNTDKIINPLYKTIFQYNADGKRTTIEYSGYGSAPVIAYRTNVYDLRNNILNYQKKIQYQNGKTYTVDSDQAVYNKISQLTSITNRVNQTESCTYDPVGRIQSKTRFDRTTFLYSYTSNSQSFEVSWNNNLIQYTYEDNGNIKTISDGKNTLQYDYYLDGSLKTETYPDNRVQTYNRDSYSRIVNLVDVSGQIMILNYNNDNGFLKDKVYQNVTLTYVYDTINNVNGILKTLSLSGAQELNRNFYYDEFLRLNQVNITDETQKLLFSMQYTLDAQNKLTESKGSLGNGKTLNKIYQYDGLSQLINENVTDLSAQSKSINTSYEYDGNSNVLSKIVDSDGQQQKLTYTYNAIDQLQSKDPNINYYDTNGRMVTDDQGNIYQYNELDQLCNFTSKDNKTIIKYSYYPNGLLCTRDDTVVGTQNFYYNNSVVNAILSQENSWTTFLPNNNECLVAYTNDKTQYCYISSNDSTALIINASENQYFVYDGYGKLASKSASPPACNSFMWKQNTLDPETGLMSIGSLLYNPSIMRFMSMNSSFDCSVSNKYAFGKADPINNS